MSTFSKREGGGQMWLDEVGGESMIIIIEIFIMTGVVMKRELLWSTQ